MSATTSGLKINKVIKSTITDYSACDLTSGKEEMTELADNIYQEPLNALMEEFDELRPRNGRYNTTNTPPDDDDDEEYNVLLESKTTLLHSAVAVAFDINAEIESINSKPDFLDVDVEREFIFFTPHF